MTYNNLLQELKAGKYKPVYFLTGEESWFIDRISSFIADSILQEDEKPFNLHLLYGRDTSMDLVVGTARRFPLMSSYQVVIVKEAQQMGKLDGLEHYISSPMMTTILVFCYKHKKLDKRSKMARLIAENCVLFESDRLREDKVPAWIISYMEERGFQIEQKASWLLVDYLGNELSKITNELDKLILLLQDGENTITAAQVEQNIGISKDFNNFELTKALVSKDLLKANRIIQYFARNPRNNPMVMTISTLFYFFSKILLVHGFAKKNGGNSLAKELGVNPYFVSEYQQASKAFSLAKTREIISMLRMYDIKSKGLGSVAPDGELLKELVYKILH